MATVRTTVGQFAVRATTVVLLAAIEFPLIAFLFDPSRISANDRAWRNAVSVTRETVPFAVFFLVALLIIFAPRRHDAIAAWRAASARHPWRALILFNVMTFGFICVGTLWLNTHGAALATPPWEWTLVWAASIVFAYGLLALAAAPIGAWRRFFTMEWLSMGLAATAAAFVLTAALVSRESWNALSAATFHFSSAILSFFGADVTSIPDARILGANGFDVRIAAACAGYEGIGLVLAFLSIYLWIFRAELRFPNALWLLPMGVILIWTLNAFRIAALVGIGAHISPEIALTGFHSQAGWMTFVVVTIGLMLAAHQINFFRQRREIVNDTNQSRGDAAMALLIPFLAVTAGGILATAFSGEGYWLYGVKVVAGVAALYVFLAYYRTLNWSRSPNAALLVGVSVGVGVLWILTQPARGEPTALGAWLATLPPFAVAAWLILRGVGTIILVPFVEELAFRGYLHRKLINDSFSEVPEGAFSWKAFLISSALFGAVHDRWLAGALAGAAFALIVYKTGRLSSAMIAHAVANAIIFTWAIARGDWALL